ncbi:amino acid adenylation domain-containing protein [Streptomyces sp. NPDC048172]|uniref:amino acid adenylation domain-containing protein n=1 Tax=Streptomyces sp. NPDC048172 TaxID=3365505 RepID=UPI0037208B4A
MHARRPLALLTAQAGIHYAQQLAPESTAFQTADRVEIRGALDADRFLEALRGTVEEADTLRLRVTDDGDSPAQHVEPLPDDWSPHLLDVRDAADPEAEATAWMRAELAAASGLMAQALLRLADDRWWWYQRVHHVAVDAYALRLLGVRVAARYTALVAGRDPEPSGFAPLSELVEEERAYLSGEQYAADREFWAARMAGRADTVPPTPATAEAPAEGMLHRAVELDADAFERISRAAEAVKATWAEVALAATAGYLHRVTGAEDVVLGLPLTNRRGPAALRTPAMTVNVLPLRLAVRPHDTGAELLRRVVLEMRAVRRHQRYPQADLRRDLALSSADTPLTGPMVNVKPFGTDLDLAGLTGILHSLAAGPVEDLSIGFAPSPGSGSGGGLRLTLDARAGRYDEDGLARHERALLTYLDGLAGLLLDDPQTPVGRLDLLGPDDVRAATAGRSEPPAARTVPASLAAQAARTPDAVAVRAADGTLTFAGLDAAADALAARLRALGAGRGRAVALALPRGTHMVTALFAVLRAGAVCQPLDLGHPAERTRAVLEDAAPVCVVGTRATLAALDTGDAATLVVDGTETSAADTGPWEQPAPGDPAYLIHTSGSTGRPKGVLVTHASLANLRDGHAEDHIAPAVARAGRERLRVAHSASFAFDASWDPLLWMVQGHELHLLDDATYRDPAALAAYVDTHRVDYLDVTPSYAEALLTEGLLAPGHHRPTVLVLGGEAVSGALWERLTVDEGLHVIDLYGPTEATVDAYYRVPGGPDVPGAARAAGRPVRGSRVYVLDACLRPVPAGGTGELYLAGACLARGYLGRPDLTAERFVADPFGAPGERMYRTGDLVRRAADGTLAFLGRTDDQVKIRGFRIELGEIQTRLASHPGVAHAAVVTRDGPHGKRLLAYAVPGTGGGAAPAPRELVDHLSHSLPAHMVPSTVTVLDALPVTANGKLDQRALPEPAAEGGEEAGPVDPFTEIVCGVFADVLGMDAPPAPGAGFFELGGHSLLAGRLAARLREDLGARIGLADVFRHPTPAALAARLRAVARDDADVQEELRALPRATDRPTELPLSPAQQRLWFLQRLEGPSATYNIPLVLTLDGPLDRTALRAALADLVARHETLRTLYPDDGGHQLVLPAGDERARVEPRFAAPEEHIEDAVRHGFALAGELPLRATVFTEGPERHVLLLLLHHIAGDGASMTPLAQDLAAAYTARVRGAAPGWAPLPVQYADVADRQRRLLGTPEAPTPFAKDQLAYWKEALAGLPDQLELPTDRPRPAVASTDGDTVPFALDAATHEALRRLARANGASVFMTVQAGLAALLTRHGCGTDIPLGTPVAGRDGDATAGLVGFFTNTVVLRADTSGDPDFRTLLARVRTATLGAYEHDALPFDHLVEHLNPARSLSRHPLFQTMLAWQSVPDGEFAMGPGLAAEMRAVPSGTAKFDLTLNAGERPGSSGGGISGFLEFRTDLFDRTTAQALSDRLARLLTAAAREPDTPLGLLPLLSAEERHRAVVEWNTRPAPPPAAPVTLAEVYERAAAAYPSRTAVTCEGLSLTYEELSARAHRLARLLAARGIGPGSIVALALPRSPDLVTGLLAVSLSGAAYLPLDPGYPADRLAYMLEDARPAAVVTDAATAPGLPGAARELPMIAVDGGEDAAYGSGPLTDDDRIRPLTPRDTAYVIYTSGSTGKPKGVLVTHENATRLLSATDHWFGFGPDDVWTLFHSYAFDFSVWELWGALLYGGRVVVVPHLTSRDPRAFLRLLADEGVTVLNQTPSAFHQLAAADREDPELSARLALRYVVFGGEALELARLDDWYARHADDAPTLVNMYGITETTVHVSYLALDRATAAGATSSTIGVNIPDLRVYVLDARLRPVPPGVTGEMYVAGRGVARGYLGRPALTATRFVADPYAHLFGESGARMYRSGDLARRRADSTLEYFGRADQQVKLRGFRIELGEIEAVLAAHPAVADAAVTVREDVPGDRRLVGYVVPAARTSGDGPLTEGPLTEGLLRDHASAELPAHMVPSAVVLLDALPLTSNGKLDRKALPAPEVPAAGGGGRPPRTPREEQLCAVFAEVLGLPRTGVDDNFFALGGHSLLAVRLASRIEAAFGVRVSIGTVFQHPTPAALDTVLEGGAAGSDDPLDVLLPLRPAAGEGERAPLFCVHPAGGLSWCYAGLIRNLPPDVPIYGLQAQGVGAATAHAPLPASLEELAAHYADRAREVQPAGRPYRLLGWSTGGIIAHAVAALLQERGEEVELLAVLDAYPAEGFRELPEADEAEALESLLAMGGYGPEALEGGPVTPEGVVEVLRREGSPLASLPPSTIEALGAIYLNTNRLVRNYDHRSFDGDVLFFRATVDTVDEALTPDTWSPYVRGRIDNTDVACSHKDMTLPEPITRIARVVADRLTALEH